MMHEGSDSDLLDALLKRGNPKEPVPFQEILPLKLKPTVSGKGNKESDVCCVYEMSLMLACFKDNDFEQIPCSKEINAFQNCYQDHMKSKHKRREKEVRGMLTPGDNNLSYKQINTLLKRYPNVK